jgi:anti-sigma B factor antagonist
MISIEKRVADSITILDVEGMLIGGQMPESLSHQIKALHGEGANQLLVNLQGVTLIDSWGIGELIAGFTCVKKAGGVLKVCSPSGNVVEVFRIVRLNKVLDVFESESEAIASFS